MKITSDNPDGLTGTVAPQAKEIERLRLKESTQRGDVARPADSDSVQISELSAELLSSSISTDSPIETRVVELAAAYAKGEYDVDAGALSRAIVRQALGEPQEKE